MQRKIKNKQESFIEVLSCTDGEEKWRVGENYKIASKEAKKAVTEARNAAYKRMYEKLEPKDEKRDMFKIAKARDRKRQYLGVVKFIKGEEGHVLIKEQDTMIHGQ